MKPILHLFYKEWIKTRLSFICSLLVGIGVVFYIFMIVENKMTLTGAKTYTMNVLYSNPPIIYYSLLRYIPILIAICVGVSQYMPEVVQKRIRLTLHLPLDNRRLFLSMELFGLLLITVANVVLFSLFYWKNHALFPTEVTHPVEATALAWFLAAYVVYNYIAMTALEPNRVRQVVYAITGVILLTLYFHEVPFHGAYAASTPALALLAVATCPLMLFSGFRFNKGER